MTPARMSSRLLISIHALLAESDCYSIGHSAQSWHFYPRSPCGERRWLRCWQLAARDISIHALLAESDVSTSTITICTALFLSTLSLRRATCYCSWRTTSCRHFYPRSPCGERLSSMLYDTTSLIFLSTLSLRRATFSSCRPDEPSGISIHALLAESDRLWACSAGSECLFLSTLSLRRATRQRG